MLVSFQNEHNQTLQKKAEIEEELQFTKETKERTIQKLNGPLGIEARVDDGCCAPS